MDYHKKREGNETKGTEALRLYVCEVRRGSRVYCDVLVEILLSFNVGVGRLFDLN